MNRLLGNFKTAAMNLVGEAPKPAETDLDFFSRLADLSASELRALAKKNHIKWRIGNAA